MRPVCSVCGKKPSAFSSSHIFVENAFYCEKCFRDKAKQGNSAAALEFIMQQKKKRNYITATRLSADKIKVEYQGVYTDIHILLSEAKIDGYIKSYFYGIDMASRQLVYISFDNDPEYSSVWVLSMTAEEFLQKVAAYPENVRSAFAGFTQETANRYLSVSFPYDLTIAATLMIQESVNTAKVCYLSHAGRFYVQVSRQVLTEWRKGKDGTDCIFSLNELIPYAEKKYVSDNSILSLKMETTIIRCLRNVSITEPQKANCFYHNTINNPGLKSFSVPEENVAEFFAVFEKAYEKKFR